MSRGYLYLSISVSGASVLAVEILGTRILGPSLGVSIFLWSALITVTLAALSVGYALGGRWADRKASLVRFALLLVASGIWLAAVPAIRGPIVAAARPFEQRVAMFLVSLILFFPPLAILGMVSPFALKLRAQSLGEVGRAAGDLFAISTLASVGAALLTGFILVPRIGVSRLMVAIGIILIATGVPGLLGLTGRYPRSGGAT
jgi:predicted membrane-bound spermidine synthase